MLDRAAMTRAFAALKRMKEVADAPRRHPAGRGRHVGDARSAQRRRRSPSASAASSTSRSRSSTATAKPQLSWRSVAHHFRLENARTLVADIGGGSLELIGAVDGLVEVTASLPLGAVRLTEEFLTGEHNTRKEVAALRKHIRRTPQEGAAVARLEPGGA